MLAYSSEGEGKGGKKKDLAGFFYLYIMLLVTQSTVLSCDFA